MVDYAREEGQMSELETHERGDFNAVVARVRAGVPVSEAAEVMRSWSIPIGEFAVVLGVSEDEWRQAQVARAERVLSPVESDRLVRVTQVLEHARAVFDSEQEAAAWLAMPNPSLSGTSPMAWLDTDAGVHCVDDVLTRLEFGVYA